LVTKGSDELTTNVPHNLKQNIVAGEYIDISLLFVNSMSSSNDSQKITFVQGELIIQPKQSHPKINSIEVWTDAFMVALSVFGSALPEAFIYFISELWLINIHGSTSNPPFSNKVYKCYAFNYNGQWSKLNVHTPQFRDKEGFCDVLSLNCSSYDFQPRVDLFAPNLIRYICFKSS
jgi:hypothetical protein